MLLKTDYITARNLLLEETTPVATETVNLLRCANRVLAQDVIASDNVPAFDRSPYDGYTLRSEDVANASKETPVTLQILEEIPAGSVPTKVVVAGTASKILTGAPIPEGADCVINLEATQFTDTEVTLFAPVKCGKNIVRVGEDVKKGAVLAKAGQKIDAGCAGTIAAQGIIEPVVYKVPKIGILSTGSEVMEPGEEILPGKIRNINSYTIAAALEELGMEPVYLGIVGDDTDNIVAAYQKGLDTCDAVISTGGVSVGDYDLCPVAMDKIGAEILIRGVDLKPGMACAYAKKDGKILFGLSGNPASCMVNFYTVALPALKKLAGLAQSTPEEFTVTLKDGFGKKSMSTRVLRGSLDLSDGEVVFNMPKGQGNVILSATIGCDVMALIPSGTPSVAPGTKLKAFFIK